MKKSLKLFLFIVLVQSLAYCQAPAKSENISRFDEVDSWEQARRVFDSAIIARDMDKKVELYNRVLKFYEKQEPKPYEDMLRLYYSLILDYLDNDNFQKIDEIKSIIINDFPKEFHYKVLSIEIETEFQNRNYEAVIKKSDEYIKIRPQVPMGYIYQSLAYLFLEREIAKAKDLLNYILDKTKTAEFGYLYRGICSTRLGEYDAAIADFDFYLKATRAFGPKSSLPYYFKAICYFKKGEMDKAKENIALGRKINTVDLVELSKRNDALFKEKIEKEIAEIDKQISSAG